MCDAGCDFMVEQIPDLSKGFSDAIIVESGDKLLILNRADEQDLKQYMKKLKS